MNAARPRRSTSPPTREVVVDSGQFRVVRHDVTGMLAHDLKTPLSAIAMNLDFALAELPEGPAAEAVRAALEDCRTASARAFRMIADMTDLSKLERRELHPTLEPVDARAALERVAAVLDADARSRRVTIAVSVDAPMIRADEDLLRRTLENLAEITLRFSRVGGTIQLFLREREIHVECDSIGGAVPSRRTASGSRGLALHFAQVAMRAQGGDVRVDDETGSTRFVIVLPA